MDAHLMQVMQAATGLVGGLMMIVALFVLWNRSPSGWLLLALAGEGVSLLFRLAFSVVPGMLAGVPAILMVWQACALMVAAGLLGYALEAPAKRA
ncbi:MAG TPA: hypothetical protein VGH80_04335 [Xanthomonadaceae bacterium]|jgi:hypothetical protein